MRVIVESDNINGPHNIRIRREGLFVCLDRDITSHIWSCLSGFLQNQAREFDVPLRVAFLSSFPPYDSAGEGKPGELPSLEDIRSQNTARRGSFITPLVENVFHRLGEKEFDLILFVGREPLDFADWQKDRDLKFNTTHVFRINDLEKLTQVEMEKSLLNSLFSMRIDQIHLFFGEAIPLSYPKEFELRVKKGELVLTGNPGSHRADIPLLTYSNGDEATVKLCVDQNLEVTARLRNSSPQPVSLGRMLSESNAKLFFDHIKAYGEVAKKCYCPLCRIDHKFDKAFSCSHQRNPTRLFTGDTLILEEIEKMKENSSRLVIFQLVDDGVLWGMFSDSVVPLTKTEFIIVPDQGDICRLEISRELCYSDLEKGFGGLLHLDGHNMYFLRLR